MTPVAIPIPAEVVLPMKMHAGAPAVPLVTVGEMVRVGQLIGQAGFARRYTPAFRAR
jgi:electron transport complex protein RnfC